VGTFRLTLEYDGAGFEGWQRQPRDGCPTVQGALEQAFQRVTGRTVRVVGSGRTDAGVHAEGQVASVELDAPMSPERLQRALNGVLPRGVAVLELVRAPQGFDARRDARSKLYRYALWNGPVRSPLRAHRSLHVERPLDLAALRVAAGHLVGRHDFASFQAAGSSVATSERTLLALEVRGEAGAAIELLFEGSGFLRHMVRNLVGTLLEVGAGRRDPEQMPGLLAARSRALAGPTAPAHALTLLRVSYDSTADSAGSA
jgi:tRNA pseudouridine38-40 synthase